MKKRILIAILVMAAALPITAQVRLGIRGGVTVDKLHFDREVLNSDNRVGYTGGLVLDLNIPVVGLGAEVSAMYTRRNNRLTDGDRIYKRHYLEIPVYARYRLTIPGVDRFFAPYAFTGPNFAILFNENSDDYLRSRKTYVSWDAGVGADLFGHLRISAAYGLGITKAMSYINSEYNGDQVNGRDRHWTLNAAWLF
ncbi:MAG: PorT family protein [Muribaculaceae bacterium]|nr:PorT family protein [Muribaculaceae bacterium]